MTTLRHRLLDGSGKPIVGKTASVAAYRPHVPPGMYQRAPFASAISDSTGWLTWQLPTTAPDSDGLCSYVVTGIETNQVLISVAPDVSTTTVSAVRVGTLAQPPGGDPSRDLVTEDELADRLSRLSVGVPVTDTDKEDYVPSRLSDASLKAAYGTPDSAPVALISGFGDSQMAHGIPHLAFAAAISGKFAVADIVSHPGYTSSALLPLITDITQSTKKPAACLLACGANDAIAKTPLATFTANVTAMIAALKAAGISVILATIPPLDDDTERPFQQQYNVWIQRYGRANRIPVVPFATVLSDVNGKWNPAYSAGDGVHQSDAGNKAMGQAFANAVSFLPTDGILPAYQGGQNLVTNGLFTTDTNMDLIPDTWSIGSTTGLTLNLAAATGVRGQKWSVTVTDGGSHTFTGGGIDAAANTFAPGDRIRVAARIGAAQDGGSSNLQLTCFVTPAYSVALNTPVLTPFGTGALDVQLDGGVVMQEFTVPANTNLLLFQWAVSGNGTYDIAQLGVWNLTKLGVA